MFIEQSIKPGNKFWKYLAGTLLVVFTSMLGQVPFTVAILAKTMVDGTTVPSDPNKLMTILDSNLTLFLIMFAYVFILAGIYLVVRVIHKQSFLKVTTARKQMDWNRFFFSFFIWSAYTIISTVVMYCANPGNFIVNFKLVPFLILLVISVLLIPIQTSCEEYIFRGYLMQGFGILAMNKWVPLVVTSVSFGMLHVFNPEVDKMGDIALVNYIATGFLLGIMTLMDDGMELSLGFHAANNLICALLVTADWSVFQTHSILKDISEPAVGFDIIMPIIIVYPILLFIFSKKYGWKNWKEKLTGKIYPETLRTVSQTETIDNHG